MSRRDFEAIAKIISTLREDSLYAVLTKDRCRWIDSGDLVNQLSNYFRSQNPRFDRDRFWNACQTEVENDTSNSNRSVSPLV